MPPVPKCVSYTCPKGRMTDTGFFLAHEWYSQGRSINLIGKRLGVAWRTVKDHLKHLKPPSARAYHPQPPKLSAIQRKKLRNRRLLVQKYHAKKVIVQSQHFNSRGPKAKPVTMTRREFPSCASIARRLVFSDGITASPMTIRRDLWHWGAKAYRRPKGPRIRITDPEQRLHFCRKIQHIIRPEDLLFSDEKLFDCNDHGCMWEWVMPGEEVEPLGRDRWTPKVHVWAVIGVGKKKLVFLPPRTINAEIYRDWCLKTSLDFFKKKVLVQDGARAHTSSLIKDFCELKKVNVVKNWPPRSPDLNPIENLWAIIARKVSDCGPTDVKQLTAFIKKEWDAFPQSEIDALVMSFQNRVTQCIKNKGRLVK